MWDLFAKLRIRRKEEEKKKEKQRASFSILSQFPLSPLRVTFVIMQLEREKDLFYVFIYSLYSSQL